MIAYSRLSAKTLVVCLSLLAIARADDPASAPLDQSSAGPAVVERLSEEASRAVAGLYEVERSIPLEARIVEKTKQDGRVREKVVFRGAQGFLVPGYFELPHDADGPCPCVLLLHGWSGSKENWWQRGNYVSGGNARQALLAAGFAVMALDAQCHGDRIAENDFAPVNHYVDENPANTPRKGYFTQVDIYIQTTRDYRRAIDYLETRTEIDKQRIGVLGYSMGGTQTFLLAGVEPRIRVAVAVAAPAENSKWSAIAPQNFVRGIGQRPFLTIMGRSDPMCTVEHAEAMQSLIDSKTKEQIFFDAGHKLPADYVPRAVDWFVQHLRN
jgi:dienelactone hydrolase